MPIHYEKTGHVARFTIDNGDLGIFTPSMHKQLFELLRAFTLDPDVHVGILCGRRGASFSAGDDIKLKLPERTRQQELESYLFHHAGETEGEERRPGWEMDVMNIERFKPIVGAIDRYCLGQGLLYLLHLTDIRIATRRASFGFPEVAYGMGGAGGQSRLGRQIPHTAAMYHLLTGEMISAEAALAYHLVNELVEDEHALQARCEAIAAKIAGHPPIAIRVEMEAYYQSLDLSRHDTQRYVTNLYRLQRLGYEGYGAGSNFLKKKGAAN